MIVIRNTDASPTRHEEARSWPFPDITSHQMQLALPPQVAQLGSISARSSVWLTVALIAASAVSASYSSISHSLLVTSTAWAFLWIYASLRTGIWDNSENAIRRKYSWTAGALLSLAQVCEQAARDPEGIWWTKVGSLRMRRCFSEHVLTRPDRRCYLRRYSRFAPPKSSPRRHLSRYTMDPKARRTLVFMSLRACWRSSQYRQRAG